MISCDKWSFFIRCRKLTVICGMSDLSACAFHSSSRCFQFGNFDGDRILACIVSPFFSVAVPIVHLAFGFVVGA